MFPIIPYNLSQSARGASYTDSYSSSSQSKVVASCDIPRDIISEVISLEMLCGKLEQFNGQLEVELNEKNLLSLKSRNNSLGNISWVRAMRFSDDCHSYNARLCLQKSQNISESVNLVIQITRPIRTGHELLLWFSEDILANLQMAFLTPANIQGQKKYVCHICSTTFEYPNPLKLHLTLDCNRQQISHLWDQLVKLIKKLPSSNTSSSTSKPPFGFHLKTESNQTLFSKELHSILNLSKSTNILKISTDKSYLIQSNTSDRILNKSPSLSPTREIQRPFSEPSTLHSSAFKPYNLTKKSQQNNNTIRLTQSVSNFANLAQNFRQNDVQPPFISNTISNSHSAADFSHAAQMETLVSSLGKSKQGHLCIYCGKCYSRKYGLKIHIRTHTGYKPLKCKYCLRPFGDPSNLNKHVRLHAEGDTPYKCELCGKVLVRRRDLERHLKSRHIENLSSQRTGQAHSSSEHSD